VQRTRRFSGTVEEIQTRLDSLVAGDLPHVPPYNVGMMPRFLASALSLAVVAQAQGQTPQPFPRTDGGRPPTTASAPAQAPAPSVPLPNGPAGPVVPTRPSAPDQADLGLPVYPAAQLLGSYDAGRGQRFYVFGTTAAYVEIVNYYRTQLNERGNQVYREPPTHTFEVGRYREDSMAFPPGVTVKDWAWGGSAGYLNPRLGAQPARFPTVVVIVTPPAAAPSPAPPPSR
jgi:hypothetical protein